MCKIWSLPSKSLQCSWGIIHVIQQAIFSLKSGQASGPVHCGFDQLAQASWWDLEFHNGRILRDSFTFLFYFMDQMKEQHREVKWIVQNHIAKTRSAGPHTNALSTYIMLLRKLSVVWPELRRFTMVYIKGWCKGKHLGRGSRLGAKTWGKEGSVTWNQKKHRGPSMENGLTAREWVLESKM